MVAAAKGEAYEIPFGGSLQLQYTADAGEQFVRASEARVEGASVHNLDGPVASVEEIIAAIEQAAPEAAGKITCGEGPAAVPRPSSTRARSPSWSAGRCRGRSPRAWPRRSRRSALSTAPSDAEPTDAP